MAMVIKLQATAGGTLQTLGTIEVQRQEPLVNPENPYLERHTYVAKKFRGFGAIQEGKPVTVEHVYGEGAWALAQKVLDAFPEEPMRPRADI